MSCPCGSQKEYANCCEPFISGKSQAPTAEALMRSRYTAHVELNADYVKNTLAPESRGDFDEKTLHEQRKQLQWLGLEVLSTKNGGEDDKNGVVEFVAKYKLNNKVFEHHEVSKFRKDKDNGRWYFVDGDAHTHEEGKGHDHHHEASAPVVREAPKVGRNDPCSCGSGKKSKKCCAA